MDEKVEFENLVEQLSNIVSKIKYHDWKKIVIAVEKKYSSEQAKMQLTNAEEIKKAIQIEF